MAGKGDHARPVDLKRFKANHDKVNWCKHEWKKAAPNPYGIDRECEKCGKLK
jgi:hypothetical protein